MIWKQTTLWIYLKIKIIQAVYNIYPEKIDLCMKKKEQPKMQLTREYLNLPPPISQKLSGI